MVMIERNVETYDGNGNVISTEIILVPDPRPERAKILLSATDVVVTRISEAVSLGETTLGAEDVIDYMNYRRTLRAIVGGSEDLIPLAPPYPQGT